MATPLKYIMKFSRDPNLEIQPVHGVFGGVTPLGEIEMNFFTESEDLPECIERTISEAGTLINEKIVYKDPHHQKQDGRLLFYSAVHPRLAE